MQQRPEQLQKARNGDRAPKDKQQEVINFVEFLELKKTTTRGQEAEPKSKPPCLRLIAADS